jgi:hypothetical protein
MMNLSGYGKKQLCPDLLPPYLSERTEENCKKTSIILVDIPIEV